MEAIWGLVLGAGAFLVWWSAWAPAEKGDSTHDGWAARTRDELVQAGFTGVTPAGLVGASTVLALVAAIMSAAITSSPVIGLCFGAIAARGPIALVRSRALAHRKALREMWPEAVDHLASGIRAGLALPEALGQLGERGPERLREPFSAFARDYRASGRFGDSLDALKARLADPVGDRVVEALRVTREVGGSDVGRLLRTLSEFLREDAHTRGELEARQSWTVNAARLAVAAPWAVLLMLSTQQQNAQAYNTPAGVTVLAVGGGATVVAYRLMATLGRLPQEQRVMR